MYLGIKVPHEGHFVIKVKRSGPFHKPFYAFLYLHNGSLPHLQHHTVLKQRPSATHSTILSHSKPFFSVTVLAGN
ncbi:unnamed protein product [Citrullus colocynthis]|uniref:Uncharacterized protein n=1 Tax=Citrullus colocynthis TaxID=252529 RepID=A0ABP0Y2W1_9ROSI